MIVNGKSYFIELIDINFMVNGRCTGTADYPAVG